MISSDQSLSSTRARILGSFSNFHFILSLLLHAFRTWRIVARRSLLTESVNIRSTDPSSSFYIQGVFEISSFLTNKILFLPLPIFFSNIIYRYNVHFLAVSPSRLRYSTKLISHRCKRLTSSMNFISNYPS